MNLIILAAGQGTRLRPLTTNMPKCMAPVHGKPLLDWQLETAKRVGIDRVTLVTGYFEKSLSNYPVHRVHNPLYASTNMVYSLYCALSELEGEVVLSYGDIIYNVNTLMSLLHSVDDINVVVDVDWKQYWSQRFEDPLDDAESLELDHNGCIQSIGQKVHDVNQIKAQYIGLMKFSPKGTQALKSRLQSYFNHELDRLKTMYMTDLLMDTINSGSPIRAVQVHRGWFEVDDLHDLEIAESRFSEEMLVETIL